MRPDVVVTDIEMRGSAVSSCWPSCGARCPSVPVVVMTAHVSVEYAVSALRAQADEFLTKPLDNGKLVEAVMRLVEEGRRRREEARKPERVLAIGAHPDDVEIGVGGLLAAHARAQDEITILTLSRGARGGRCRQSAERVPGVCRHAGRPSLPEGSRRHRDLGRRLHRPDHRRGRAGESSRRSSTPTRATTAIRITAP